MTIRSGATVVSRAARGYRRTRVAASIDEWYIRGMKVKTSVTLSEELLNAISAEIGHANRSALIEEATWRYLRERQRDARDRRELERINEHADKLNEEAFDVLEFQADG